LTATSKPISTSRDAAETPAGRRWWIDAIAIAAVILLALVINYQAIFSNDKIPGSGPNSDIWTSHWNNVNFLKTSFETYGGIPLWNSMTMSGRPFAGDPLAAIFYPPMLLSLALPLRDFFLIVMIAHLAFAGVGAYLLGRRGARFGPGASVFVAVAYIWSTRFIGHYGAGHLTMVFAASWLPWVALGVLLAIRDNPIWAAPAGLAFGLAVLAGHPQIAFYTILMIGGITLGGIIWAGWQEPDWQRRIIAGLRVIGVVLVIGIIGTLTSAAFTLPALQFTNHSLRQSGIVVTDRLPFTDIFKWLFYVKMNTSTPHETAFAPGIPVLCLAALAFVERKRRWLALGLLAGVVFCVFISAGANSPVLPFLTAHVPGFSYFRAQARIWFVAELALAVMAGFGFEWLLSRRRDLWPLQIALIALLAGNLWVMDMPLMNVEHTFNGHNPTKLESTMAKLNDGSRIYGVQRNIRQSVTTELGLHLATGQDPLQLKNYALFMQYAGGYTYGQYALAVPPYEVYDTGWPTFQKSQPNARALGLLNVGFVLSRWKLTDPNLKQVKKVDDTYVYRNEAVLPKAYLISPQLGTRLRNDSRQQLAQDAKAGIVKPDQQLGSATITSQSPGGMAIAVNARQAGYLMVGDPYYPGWQVKIDGHGATIDEVGGVLQGVAVPAGQHTIELVYRPSTVSIGLIASLLGLLAAGGWTLIVAWRARRSSRSDRGRPAAAYRRRLA